MKPTFSVQLIGNGTAPCPVAFTDTYQSPNERILTIDAGDGHILYWDTPDQTTIIHIYEKPGTFTVRAMAIGNEIMSDPVSIIIRAEPPIPEPPVPDSWIVRFLKWLLSLFGK